MKRLSFDVMVVAGIFLAYLITIRLAMNLDLRGSLLGALANTIPVVVFGALVRSLIVKKLIGKSAAIQLGGNLLLCVAFCTLAYGLLIVLLGIFNGTGSSGFFVRPLSAGATIWQSLENVTMYALIAAISYLQALSGHAAVVSRPMSSKDEIHTLTPASKSNAAADLVTTPNLVGEDKDDGARTDASPSRYFVRIGDELRPLDIDTVVSIGGADDYAEVRTLTGKHLVRVTLTEFAKSLDPAKYVRVHRSWIVNVHRIARAESAGGGRLLLHMETGQTVSTSRTGAKLLRDRVI